MVPSQLNWFCVRCAPWLRSGGVSVSLPNAAWKRDRRDVLDTKDGTLAERRLVREDHPCADVSESDRWG